MKRESALRQLICIALGAAASLPLHHAHGAITPEAFGLSSTITRDPFTGSATATTKDPRTGQVLRQTFSAIGRPIAESESTSSGRILWRQETTAQGSVFERFAPDHEATFITHSPDSRLNVEIIRWSARGPIRSTSYQLNSSEALAACVIDKTPAAEVERLMSDLRWLKIDASTTESGKTPLGNNIVAENCESFQGGTTALAAALDDALHTGLRCFKNAGPARMTDLARLLSFLNPELAPPFRIQCGTAGKLVARGPQISGTDRYEPYPMISNATAAGFRPDYGDYPGMMINVDSRDLKDGLTTVSKTVFHEMLHNLGYVHDVGLDVPYLAESCCFDQPSDISRSACALLKEDYVDTRTPEYHEKLTTITRSMGFPWIGARAAWRQTVSYLDVYQGSSARSPLSAAVSALASTSPDLEFTTRALMIASNVIASPRKPAAWDPGVSDSTKLSAWMQDGAKSLGIALGQLGLGQAADFQREWPKTQAFIKRVCAEGSEFDKTQMKQTLEMTKMRIYALPGERYKALVPRFENPCQ